MKTLLQLDGFGKCVTGEDNSEENDTKARAKIILLIDSINYAHARKATTAKVAWDNLGNIVALLRIIN